MLSSSQETSLLSIPTWVGTKFQGHIRHIPPRDGNGAGRGRRMRSFSPPRMVLSCPIPTQPRMTRNTFSPHSCPLGPHEAPPHPVKIYFLLIFPTTSTIFLMKPISLIKIYLKLQLNLSHQVKSIFRKNLNNISKCLTRQSLKNK